MFPEKSLPTKSINIALSQKSNPCSDDLYIIVFEINVLIISRHILFRKRLLMDNHGKPQAVLKGFYYVSDVPYSSLHYHEEILD